MFSREMLDQAAHVLDLAKAKDIRIATAETCTAGLVSSCLTSVPGASKYLSSAVSYFITILQSPRD